MYCEAVLSAAHADPKQSRLHGRASSSRPRLDLAEAQECCCCFPLSLGMVLLGVIDLARLGLVVAYAIDGIIVYQQTDYVRYPDAIYSHLMVPHAREVAEGFLWPSAILSGIKIVIWLMVLLTICCEFANPLRLLLLFLPIDWIHTIIFAAQNVNFAQVCRSRSAHSLAAFLAIASAAALAVCSNSAPFSSRVSTRCISVLPSHTHPFCLASTCSTGIVPSGPARLRALWPCGCASQLPRQFAARAAAARQPRRPRRLHLL